MAGIQQTKEMVAFAMALLQAGIDAAKDGKVGVSDMVALFAALKEAPVALSGVDEIPAEMKDLTEQELHELVDFVKLKFDLPNDQIEAKIELAFDVAMAFVKASINWPK